MVFGLFETTVEVELVTDRTRFLPGEAVTVRARVTPSRDLRAQSGWVELWYVLRYRYRESSGNDLTATELPGGETAVDEILVADDCLFEQAVLPGKVASEYQVTLWLPARTVPLDDDDDQWGPPTCEGKVVSVQWFARLRLYRRRAADVRKEIPLVLLSHPPTAAATAEPDRVGARCDIALEPVPDRTVRVGQPIAGVVRISPREDVDARGVRVELLRREHVPHGAGLTSDVIVASTAVAGPTPLRVGSSSAYPYELAVPADACPTVTIEQFTVEWFVRAVVDLPWRGDDHLLVPVGVHTA